MYDDVKKSAPFWILYILLVLAPFCMYASLMNIMGIITLLVLVGAYILRSHARKNGQEAEAAHASWMLNTVWLSILLGVVLCAVIVALCLWIGTNDALQAEFQSISDGLESGALTPVAGLKQMWAIPGIKLFTCIVILNAFLYVTWPLKRALHGLLALYSKAVPTKLGSLRWVALGIAVLSQIALPFLM